MSDFDISLLRSFVQVIDSGSFARAGERVHRTQSSISQHIKKLEEHAGRQLLLRNARMTRPTADGERMLAYARRILALHDEARNLFAEDLPELVRIGLPEDYAVQALPHLLAEVARHHPHARLEVRSMLSLELRAAFEAGELDIALYRRVATAPEANAASDDDASPTWPDPLHWVAAHTSQAEHPPERQAVLPLVLFPHGCVYRAYALAQLQAQGRRWREVYTSPNMAGVLAAVQAGLGVTLQSRHVIATGGAVRALDGSSGLPPVPHAHFVLRSTPGPSGGAHQAVLARLRAQLTQATQATQALKVQRAMQVLT